MVLYNVKKWLFTNVLRIHLFMIIDFSFADDNNAIYW
jgi:hypothetical protein